MLSATAPAERVMEERDMRALLARSLVGRLAFVREGRIEIRPILFVYTRDSIYGRLSEGKKCEAFAKEPMEVAFEVDEWQSIFRWKSVIVRGEVELLDPEGEEWERVVGDLRRVIVHSFEDGDPVPQRTQIFCLKIRETSGREMG